MPFDVGETKSNNVIKIFDQKTLREIMSSKKM